MTPFRHILVPTDFSEPAENAAAWAVDLALQFCSRLTLLHAYWLPPMAYGAFASH
jgi:nucleotide-binding universal stress UspA family protein